MKASWAIIGYPLAAILQKQVIKYISLRVIVFIPISFAFGD
jgi:hypothetical protein